MCTDSVSSRRGSNLIPVINHIHSFVIVTLITLLEAHPDGMLDIAGRCARENSPPPSDKLAESRKCVLSGGGRGWRRAVFALGRCPGGFFVQTDVISPRRADGVFSDQTGSHRVSNTTVVLSEIELHRRIYAACEEC